MKNDIMPPKLPRPVNPVDVRPPQSQPTPSITSNPPESPSRPSLPMLPAPVPPNNETEIKKRRFPRLSFKLFAVSLVCALLLAAAGAGVWYFLALQPVNSKDTSRERINIPPGSSLATIGDLLEQKHLIRNQLVFNIYARLTGAGSRLQAGTYSLSPSESAATIIAHFTSGKVDQFTLTFLPGATLRHLPGETSTINNDVESVLMKAGYGKDEIETAFAKTYDDPLFTDKPAGTDLEGYVYGETYKFNDNATVEQILKATFNEYDKVIKDNNLVDSFKAQGLNLYQGITLASIIQREVTSPADQKQVAQIFLTRLKQGIPLGSDVTYQYAAKKEGVPPSPTLDSPYNTRQVPGLPPGPIAMPGLSALQAVAAPAPGDYLYFLNGDDGVMYYSHTNQEHEANIQAHCREKCKGA